MEVIGTILVLLSLGVFLWAVVGLINPVWARLPHRKMSVAVWALSAVLAVAGGSLLPSDDSTEGTESGVGVSAPASNQATESELPPAPAPAPAAPLVLLSLTGSDTGVGFHTVEGQVRNTSAANLENVMAVVSWFTAEDTFITSDEALIAYNPILPEQTSPFEITTQTNPAMSRFRVEFKTMFGGMLRYEDQR